MPVASVLLLKFSLTLLQESFAPEEARVTTRSETGIGAEEAPKLFS